MILVLSPHLDDAAFSCAGYLLHHRAETKVVVTCFTQSVPDPQGFALACQLDKGLPASVDYMLLRREEDKSATALLGAQPIHLPLPEAPHRGYHSAAELFESIHDRDSVAVDLGAQLQQLLQTHRPHTVLYPYGAGNHVDHQQVIQVVDDLRQEMSARFIQFYDQPYTHRHPGRYPELDEAAVWDDTTALPLNRPFRYTLSPEHLRQKLAACAAYASQLGFQFTDAAGMHRLLGDREYYRVVQ